MVYEAVDAASLLNASSLQAAPGELVAKWNDQNGTDSISAPAANQPTLASDADGLNSPTGVRPLKFRSSQALFDTTLKQNVPLYDIFVLARLRGGNAENQSIVGNSIGNFKTPVFQSTSSNPGALCAGSTVLEVSSAERLRLIRVWSSGSSGAVLFGSLNGSEAQSTPGSVRDAFSDSYVVVGNLAGTKTNAGANMDLFAFCFVPTALTRANAQRMEGYLAWRAGLQSTLDPGHPYYNSPPTVPAGTTSTLAWVDANVAGASALQTWRGPMCEVQADSYDGSGAPPIDGSTKLWGIPYSLTVAERARLKAEYFPGDGTGYMYLRFPLGFAYRGIRATDPGSGLGTQIGERFSGQNAALADMIADVAAAGGGLMPEYWSPAPHFKTSSTYGNGSLWAGGSYARTVTLDSIRTSDPAQYAAQIDLLAAAMVNDLEYLHQNVGPVRGFSPQNEAFNATGAGYGTCTYQSGQLFADVSRAVFARIDASAILATYAGKPNTVWGIGPSWQTMPAEVTGDAPLYARFWAVAQHQITLLSADGDKAKTIVQAPGGKQTIDNEFEYFSTPAQGRDWQFANTALVQAGFMVRSKAETHNPMIHIAKQLGQTGSGSSTENYGVVAVRLPAPFSGAPTDPGDPYPALGHGEYINQGWNSNAVKTFTDNIVAGSKVHPRFYPGTLPAGVEALAFVRPDGGLGWIVVNRNDSVLPLAVGLGGVRTVTIRRYSNSEEGVVIDHVTSSAVDVSIQPNSTLTIGEEISIPSGADIAVERSDATNVADGESLPLGKVALGRSLSFQLTIRNSGYSELTGLSITKSGADSSDFSIISNPTAPLAPAGTTTFAVRFAPAAAGTKQASIQISSNDPDESPYDITFSATALANSDNDSASDAWETANGFNPAVPGDVETLDSDLDGVRDICEIFQGSGRNAADSRHGLIGTMATTASPDLQLVTHYRRSTTQSAVAGTPIWTDDLLLPFTAASVRNGTSVTLTDTITESQADYELHEVTATPTAGSPSKLFLSLHLWPVE